MFLSICDYIVTAPSQFPSSIHFNFSKPIKIVKMCFGIHHIVVIYEYIWAQHQNNTYELETQLTLIFNPGRS